MEREALLCPGLRNRVGFQLLLVDSSMSASQGVSRFAVHANGHGLSLASDRAGRVVDGRYRKLLTRHQTL